ncbi:MAG: hypothetical protein F9K29_09040 [Hyphomicrobiaceae bacterium]|nr:MAG: hypothetical protein F9K29_09040 [Hyphomicrobiaceae bacterium]
MRPISIFLCCVALGASGPWGTLQAADLILDCKCTESDITNLRTKKREVKQGGCGRHFNVAIDLKPGCVEYKNRWGDRVETYNVKVAGSKVSFRTEGEEPYEAPGEYTIDTARKVFTEYVPLSAHEKASKAPPLLSTFSGSCTAL